MHLLQHLLQHRDPVYSLGWSSLCGFCGIFMVINVKAQEMKMRRGLKQVEKNNGQRGGMSDEMGRRTQPLSAGDSHWLELAGRALAAVLYPPTPLTRFKLFLSNPLHGFS